MRAARKRLAGLAAAAFFAVPVAAHAGTYDVVTCNAPGAGGVNRSWTPEYTAFQGAAHPEMYDVFDDCAGAQGGLVANSHNGNAEYGNAPFLTGGVWRFSAPAGTTISHITLWRHAIKYRVAEDNPPGDPDEGDVWLTGGQQENGNVIGGGFGETCKPPAGTGATCEYGADGINSASQASYDLSATQIQWGSNCLALSGCGRFYGVSTSNMKINGARVTLTDSSAPTLSVGGPLLADGWHRPGDELTYAASDNAGIRSARIESGTLAATDQRACDYTQRVPCGNVPAGRLTLPTLPDGTQPIRVVAEDTAGNAAALTREVKVDGTAPLARLDRPKGRTLRVRVEDALSGVAGGTILVRNSSQEPYRELPTTLKRGVLRARLDRGRVSRADLRVRVADAAGNEVSGLPPRITVTGVKGARLRNGQVRLRFGRRAVLRGRLTLSAGQPLAGVGVLAVTRVRRNGAGLVTLGTVTTDRRGRFRVTVPKGPSRTLGLRFAGAGEVLRGARGVGVRVPAASTIRASRRALSGPARVGFAGRLRTSGQPIPDRGLVIILQGRDHGRWLTFADTRTNRRGRWRTSYRFRGNPGQYPVRARIRRQAGFPFELGYSKRVTVSVR